MVALIDAAEQRIDRPLILDCKHIGDFSVPAKAGKGNIDIDTASNVHALKLYWTASGTAATVAEMKSDIADLRKEVRSDIGELKKEVKDLREEIKNRR